MSIRVDKIFESFLMTNEDISAHCNISGIVWIERIGMSGIQLLATLILITWMRTRTGLCKLERSSSSQSVNCTKSSSREFTLLKSERRNNVKQSDWPGDRKAAAAEYQWHTQQASKATVISLPTPHMLFSHATCKRRFARHDGCHY